MTRRVLLGTGAAVAGAAALVGGAQLTGRLDDVADAVGLDPKPLPDPGDTELVARTARDCATVLALVEATASTHAALAGPLVPFRAAVREQLEAVGGRSTGVEAVAPPADETEAVKALETVFGSAAGRRASAAADAASPDLVRVLASMSAGHAQAARAMRGLR